MMRFLLILHILSSTLDGSVSTVTLHEFATEEACAKAAVETSVLVGLSQVESKCVEIPSDDS
jgi:hypothetical protein